jgi:predicted anti-sigma-YlaC factor YlaD
MKPMSRDCQTFQDRLAEFLEHRLSPEEQQAAEAHLRSCQRCRGLLGIAEGKLDLLSQKERDELSAAILAQTSGTVCDRAREMMSDHLEVSLDTLDRQLLEAHMEHCSPCKTVFETMRHLLPLLAEMRELQPGKTFTRSVIRATSQIPGRETRWVERFRRWWEEQLARPIVQWEAAYVGALLLIATFGTPGSPLKGIPNHLAASFHQAAIALIPGEPLKQAEVEIVSFGEGVWNATGGWLTRAVETLGTEINTRQELMEPHVAAFGRHALLLSNALKRTDMVQAALHLGEMQNSMQRMWRDVRHGDIPASHEDRVPHETEPPQSAVAS